MPRANLAPTVILDKAVEFVDANGYDQLSMTKLARLFDVATPSLYKHVSSLGSIQTGIAERGIRELRDALSEAASGQTQGEALKRMAEVYRCYAHAHPGRYEAIQKAPDPSNAVLHTLTEQLLDILFGLLATYGRFGTQAVHDVRMLRSALHGFVILEAAGGFGTPLDVNHSFCHMVKILDSTFRVDGP
jgi:AcrR family transcriptional regulator